MPGMWKKMVKYVDLLKTIIDWGSKTGKLNEEDAKELAVILARCQSYHPPRKKGMLKIKSKSIMEKIDRILKLFGENENRLTQGVVQRKLKPTSKYYLNTALAEHGYSLRMEIEQHNTRIVRYYVLEKIKSGQEINDK